MVFSSNIFLFFFLPIFLIAYFITPQKFRNYTLLLFSIVFYAYGAPDFVFLLVGECVINYFIVRAMGRTDGVHTVSTCVKMKNPVIRGGIFLSSFIRIIPTNGGYIDFHTSVLGASGGCVVAGYGMVVGFPTRGDVRNAFFLQVIGH